MTCYRSAVVSVSLLAMALAGCNKTPQDMTATTANSGLPALPAALPMQTGPASQLVAAPPVSALPVRRYVGLSRPARERESYAYLDRASDVQDEIGDAPPDYDYDNDDGVRPWVWETNGGDYRYAEPASDGYRDYYYQPGEDHPYLVRTRDRSYAYAGGALVAIYLLNGALLPPDRYDAYRDEASRYYWRGQDLRHAADRRPHEGVVAANWAAQRPQFDSDRASWAAARSGQPDWQSYHARNDPSRQQGWQQEHQQRQQVAQQFASWQSRGLAGAVPAALAVAGARAMPRQPGQGMPDGRPPAFSGPPARIGPQGVGPGAGPLPGNGVQAAARDRQLAAQQQAQRQALASQRLALAAGQAQQEAAAERHAAAARQQQMLARNAAQQQGQRQALASQRAEQETLRIRQQAAAQQQAAVREQQLAARTAAQRQELAGQRAGQEAIRARQQAAAQQQAVAREQQLVAQGAAQRQALAGQRAEQSANQARQQAMAAQQQSAARQQAQQREAQVAARQEQLQAVAAQRQAQVVRAQAPAPRPLAPPAPVPRPEPARPPAGHGINPQQ